MVNLQSETWLLKECVINTNVLTYILDILELKLCSMC